MAVEFIINLLIYAFLQYVLVAYMREDYLIASDNYLAQGALIATGN